MRAMNKKLIIVVFSLFLIVPTLAYANSSVIGSLDEAEQKNFTLNGTSYAVTLVFAGSTTARFSHNGEFTGSLREGEYYTFSDNLHIHVTDIGTYDFAGGVRYAEFWLELARFNPALLGRVTNSWIGEIDEDGRAFWGQPGEFLVNITPDVIPSNRGEVSIVVENYTVVDAIEVGIASNGVTAEAFNVSRDGGLTWEKLDPIYKAGVATQIFKLNDTVKVILSTSGFKQWYSVLVRENGSLVWSVAVGPSAERITVDGDAPTFISSSPSSNYAFAVSSENPSLNLTFAYKINDYSSVSGCSLIVNNAINSTHFSVKRNVTRQFSLFVEGVTGIVTKNWSISCADAFGNFAATDNRNLTLVASSYYGSIPQISLNDSLQSNVTTDAAVLVSANFSDLGSGFVLPNQCEFCAAYDDECDTEWTTGNVTTIHSNDTLSGFCYYEWNASDYGDDDYNLSFRVKDNFNNAGLASKGVILDKSPPEFLFDPWGPRNNSALVINSTINASILINFAFSVRDFTSIANCSLVFDDKVNITNKFVEEREHTEIKLNISTNVTSSRLHNWSIMCFDLFGHNSFTPTKKFSLVVMEGFSGGTTDFTKVDLSNVQNLTFENMTSGKIRFAENVTLEGIANINDYVKISDNRIEINSSALPALNKTATLFIYNLTYANPRIIRDGVVCPSETCAIISYVNGTLSFNVTRFSVYSSEETPPGSSGSPDGSSNTGGGGGGGGGRVIVSNTTNKTKEKEVSEKQLPSGEKESKVINQQKNTTIEEENSDAKINGTGTPNLITGSVVADVEESGKIKISYILILAAAVLAVFLVRRKRKH